LKRLNPVGAKAPRASTGRPALHFKTRKATQNCVLDLTLYFVARGTMNLPPAVLIGASAGGVQALVELTAALPANFPAVVAVVLHVGSQSSLLPELLNRRSPNRALHPADGERPRPGRIYVAPPDHHMLLQPDAIRLSRGARENHARPAIDPLFRTAAIGWRERAIGVVLTGYLDDGTAGLAAIKDCGGTAVVQDPATALEPSMPASALAHVAVDHCVPLDAMPSLLRRLVAQLPGQAPAAEVPERLLREQAVSEGDEHMTQLEALGTKAPITCPDCGGGLWEIKESRPLRYRCHTGHAFTARSLDHAQAEAVDQSLWSSFRRLREREILLRRLASVAEATGDAAQAEAGRRAADRVCEQARVLDALAKGESSSA
jgi:two-component system, chemotaxis family, protein-glutamate methylesterase/glutaminase